MKTAAFVLPLLLSLGVAATGPPNLDSIDWPSLTNKTFEQIEADLGGYHLVIGQVGNVWTRLEWGIARHHDLARSYVYFGALGGQEVRIECWFYDDVSLSRLHPQERLLDLVITFDRPGRLAAICELAPWFGSMVRNRDMSQCKASSFAWGNCGNFHLPFGPAPGCIGWIVDNTVILMSFGTGDEVLKVGFFGFGLGDLWNRPSPDKCFKPWKGHRPLCALERPAPPPA